MTIDEFSSLVEEALEGIPAEFLDHLENVEVEVEEWPSRADLQAAGVDPGGRGNLLGLYHGVPNTKRGAFYVALPDRITIFKGPIELYAGPDRTGIRDQVRRTVIHEIAHYYGISDERLTELGWG
jgi:predicted Zn-dependent protease with MMP-like domain